MTKFCSICILITGMLYASCDKNNTDDGKQSTLKLRMTDNPTALEAVNIDLREVKVKLNDDSVSWINLQPNPGIYNLLDLQNGVDTLIAQATFPVGTLKEIRLILGENNTVKENGVIYPLTVPSGSESGLKIKLNRNLQASIETVLIDFDAALSVRRENDGYKLRPVIQLR